MIVACSAATPTPTHPAAESEIVIFMLQLPWWWLNRSDHEILALSLLTLTITRSTSRLSSACVGGYNCLPRPYQQVLIVYTVHISKYCCTSKAVTSDTI